MGKIKIGKKGTKTAGQEVPKENPMPLLREWERKSIIDDAVKEAKEQIFAELTELGVIGGNTEDNTIQDENTSGE